METNKKNLWAVLSRFLLYLSSSSKKLIAFSCVRVAYQIEHSLTVAHCCVSFSILRSSSPEILPRCACGLVLSHYHLAGQRGNREEQRTGPKTTKQYRPIGKRKQGERTEDRRSLFFHHSEKRKKLSKSSAGKIKGK